VQDVVDERQANTLHVNVDFHLHALQLTRLHAQQLHAIKQTDTNIRLVTYFFQDNLEMPVPFLILIRQQMTGFWDGSGTGQTICKESAPRSTEITTITSWITTITSSRNLMGQMLSKMPN